MSSSRNSTVNWRGTWLALFQWINTNSKARQLTCTGFTVSYRRLRELGINVYYIPIGVKSTAQIFGPFGDQKYSDSVNRIWFRHESRNLANSKSDRAVVLLHIMRSEIEKQFILGRDCANRRRPLLTYLRTTRDDAPGSRSRSTRRGTVQTVTDGREPVDLH